MFDKAIFADKVVIVTGGTRGIGRAIVELFAGLGANVHFFYQHSTEQAQHVVADCQTKNYRAQAWQVDVRDQQQCCATIAEIQALTQRIDVLVNNSGIVRDGLLAGLSEEDITSVLDTNLLGVFHVTQAVVPFMMSQRAGKIINMSSVAAKKGGRGQANYAASKGAINAFTKSLAVELAKRNITVNAVAPGIVETDMTRDVREMGGDEALSKILLKRFGQPQEIAYAVAFLASSYADYINGVILPVDGGFKMN